MCQNGVSHHTRAEEVLLCDVIYRKLHPDHYGGPLCCGNDALRRWRNRTGKNYHVGESEWLEQQGAVTKKKSGKVWLERVRSNSLKDSEDSYSLSTAPWCPPSGRC